MEKHIGKIEISSELLKIIIHSILRLPDDAHIIRIEISPEWFGVLRGSTIYVEHDSFPLVREGEAIPQVGPILDTHTTFDDAPWYKSED